MADMDSPVFPDPSFARSPSRIEAVSASGTEMAGEFTDPITTNGVGMEDSDRQTLSLLQQWHAGERNALHVLLERDLPWIRSRVRKRLGPMLRMKAESEDFVQDAMVDVLRNGPRFLISSHEHFRALMARIVENVLRDQYERFNAGRRRVDREQPMPQESILPLDAGARSVTRPSQAVQRDEAKDWVRLAMELLEAGDRRVIKLRQWERRSFAEIGEQLEISEDTARKRFDRAVQKLTRKLRELQSGRFMEEAGES
jgi:RNA polymerase sigma-70 factor (ECF subfamily)